MEGFVGVLIYSFAIWTALYGFLLMFRRNWAAGYVRWSLTAVRHLFAWPFLLIGGMIYGPKKKRK